MIYRSDLSLPVIKVNNNAYQIKAEIPIDKIKDRDVIKEGLSSPTVIQNNNNNTLLFCRKIQEANVIEYIDKTTDLVKI